MEKFYNNAIIGGNKMVCSFSEKGELLRLCYPYIDGKQFIDYFRAAVKINDSNIIYLADDINNFYSQNYIDKTNILVTSIENSYFKLAVTQTDCVMIDDSVLIKKYVLKNNNVIDLDVDFIVDSKILSSNFEQFGSRLIEGGVTQYNRNCSFSIFSDLNRYGHRLNDVQNDIYSAVLHDKDYIGMSDEVAISYKIGKLKSMEEKTFFICIYVKDKAKVDVKLKGFLNHFDKNDETIRNVANYWNIYVDDHSSLNLQKLKMENISKIKKIYERSILLYPLLSNEKSGGIAAALESDENRLKSGSYSYCWTRDAVFITKALDIMNMQKNSDLFYNNFCRKTQLDNGMWEQRYYTDGALAPCWGYQIDETASVVYGVYQHFLNTGSVDFLFENYEMCDKAIKFLNKYCDSLLNKNDTVNEDIYEKNLRKFPTTYDLWEMNEGVHLYSLSAIIAAYKSYLMICNVLKNWSNKDSSQNNKKGSKDGAKIIECKIDDKDNEKINERILLLRNYIDNNFVDTNEKFLHRNLKESNMDISVIGAVYPFEVFEANDEVIKNTVEKLNEKLKTYTDGYLRFEGDNYIGGDKPWVITTLWMSMYYIKLGNIEQAKKCFNFVVDTACKYGFLSEQVSNEDRDFKWIIGLGWSHAMFIIVLRELIEFENQ